MTTVLRKRQFMQVDEIRTLNVYRDVFQRLCKNEHVIVVTEALVDPEALFGTYYKAFNIYIERGLLEIKTIAEMDDNDSDFVVL